MKAEKKQKDTFAEMKARIEGLVAEKDKELDELRAKLEATEKEINTLRGNVDVLKKAGNVEEYAKSFKDVEFLERTAEVYRAKIETLENEAYISKEEFNGIYKDTCNYLDEVVEKDTEALKNIIKELYALRTLHAQRIRTGNDFLKFTQLFALKDKCGQEVNGTFVPLPQLVKKYRNLELLGQLEALLTSSIAVDKMVKQIEKEGRELL